MLGHSSNVLYVYSHAPGLSNARGLAANIFALSAWLSQKGEAGTPVPIDALSLFKWKCLKLCFVAHTIPKTAISAFQPLHILLITSRLVYSCLPPKDTLSNLKNPTNALKAIF